MLRRSLIALVLLAQFLCAMASAASSLPPFDIRVTSAKDIMRYKTTIIFEQPTIKDYNNIEVYAKDQAVYVSAPNNVLKLSYRNGLNLTERYLWRPMQTDIEECRKKGPGDCVNNHIKILLLFNGTQSRRGDAIFICGTMGRKPKCTERSTQNMTKALGLWGGGYRCPYNPQSSVTALMASDGFLYLGTSTDYGSREFSILRRNQTRGSNKPELFTRQNDDRYLMEPFFVSSHEIGDYVYFFFHETSYESYISCNQKITVSRVARVCKTDPGSLNWGRKSSTKWTTYLKARMKCKKEGAPDDAYNQIASTYIDARREFLYAVFTSSKHGPPGSILCRFRISDLESIFNSNYKVQHKSRLQEWIEEENRGIMGCPKPGDPDRNARSTLSNLHQLVSGIYRNDRIPALFRDGERWMKVVATSVQRTRPRRSPLRYPVLFIATDAGTVLKVAKIKRAFCIVEIIELEKGAAIKDLALVELRPSQKSYLIATAKNKIVRIALHRCERFASAELCVGARDPFCGWDPRTGACVNVAGRPKRARFRQDLRACPTLARRLDGGWSAWGGWTTCEQLAPGGKGTLDCRCRLRTCSKPPPMLGGVPCSGPTIQVANCTIDGGWGSWSAWSACSASCGYSKRFRVRRCDSPVPSRTGRPCRGRNEISERCSKPICPPPTPTPVHGSWSAWGAWTECSSPCNTGFRKRARSCSNPAPRYKGDRCYGASWEFAKCNEEPCPEVQKFSQWTPWVWETRRPNLRRSRLPGTKARMTRYRFICVARLPDPRLLSTKVTTEQLWCDGQNVKCREGEASPHPPPRPQSKGRRRRPKRPRSRNKSHTAGHPFSLANSPDNIPYQVTKPVMGKNVDGAWSPWTSWSSCSHTCGGGRQQRTRQCDSPAQAGNGRSCLDEGIDWRACNLAPCVGAGSWSCWSDWSRCDCSTGVRVRNRRCRTEEGLSAIGCPGKEQNEEACDLQCAGGWTRWGEWDTCRGGQQQRTRRCRHDVLRNAKINRCPGASKEQRSCEASVEKSQRLNDQFNIYEVVIVGVVAFCIGCILAAVITLAYCHRKQRRLERSLNRSPHRHRSRSAPNEPTDTLTRSLPISDLPPGPGRPPESDSFLTWSPTPRHSFLDRQHSYHGTTTTSLGRQFSNTSSVRTPGKLDNCARPYMDYDSYPAYSTMPRLPSPLRQHAYTSSTAGELASTRVPAWGEHTLPPRLLPRQLSEDPAADRRVLLSDARRRGSDLDDVFRPTAAPPASETRQLLSSRYQVGE